MAHRFLCLVLLVAAAPAFRQDATAAPAVVSPARTALVAGPTGLVLQRMPTGAEASVVSAIEQQGRAKVLDLNRSMSGTQDPVLREALGREASRSKLETALQILRFRATYARAHDDAGSAEQFESVISMLRRPVISAPVATW